jgi:aspartokinase-like uncharacterized kinase
MAHTDAFDAVLRTIGATAQERRLLVVPGGGPFADLVRKVYREFHLSEDAAHWMAVLAMEQYAHLIAERLSGGLVVTHRRQIESALDGGRVPVLAPLRWLQEDDPLPHSWTVTSDSIAAWVSDTIGAARLVLVKPPRAAGSELVDAHFRFVISNQVTPVIVPADQLGTLLAALLASNAQSSPAAS